MDEIHNKPKVLLLKMSHVPYMDATGEAHLASIAKHLKKHGGVVIISEIQDQPRQLLKKNRLGRNHRARSLFLTKQAMPLALP